MKPLNLKKLESSENLENVEGLENLERPLFQISKSKPRQGVPEKGLSGYFALRCLNISSFGIFS